MREKKFQKIEIEKIELNNGQLEGLPRNPRFIRDEKDVFGLKTENAAWLIAVN